MATFDTFRPAASTRPGFVSELLVRLRGWANRRATARALDELNDRELDDLGLTRGDIRLMAEGARPARRI